MGEDIECVEECGEDNPVGKVKTVVVTLPSIAGVGRPNVPVYRFDGFALLRLWTGAIATNVFCDGQETKRENTVT